MRIDKFLKVSRIIKRRTVANEVCSAARVFINDKVAKPGSEVAIGDILEIRLGSRISKYKILNIAETVRKDDATNMYETLSASQVEL